MENQDQIVNHGLDGMISSTKEFMELYKMNKDEDSIRLKQRTLPNISWAG